MGTFRFLFLIMLASSSFFSEAVFANFLAIRVNPISEVSSPNATGCNRPENTCVNVNKLPQAGNAAKCVIAGNFNKKIMAAAAPGVYLYIFEFQNNCKGKVQVNVKANNDWSPEAGWIEPGAHIGLRVAYDSSGDTPTDVYFQDPNAPNPIMPPLDTIAGSSYASYAPFVEQCRPGVGSPNIPGHSVLNLDRQSLSEIIPLTGTPFYLLYSSDRFKDGSSFKSAVGASLGGWSLSNHHYYDVKNKIVYFGDGRTRYIELEAGEDDSGYSVGSGSGDEIYFFDVDGKHTTTLQMNPSVVLWTFSYDPITGALTEVLDKYGKTYSVSKFSFSTPYGQTTQLDYDSSGNLKAVTNPNGETYSLQSDAFGRLTLFQRPSGRSTTLTYDKVGNLITDSGSGGSSISIAALFSDGAMKIKATTATGKTTYTQIEESNGIVYHSYQNAFGGSSVTSFENGNGHRYTDMYGNVYTSQLALTPYLFDNFYESVSSLQIAKSNISVIAETTKNIEYRTEKDGEHSHQITTVTLQKDPKRVFVEDFDSGVEADGVPKTPSYTNLSPLKRKTKLTINSLRQPLSLEVEGLLPVKFDYDLNGKLATLGQGDILQKFEYDNYGNLSAIVDPLGRATKYSYDKANRISAVSSGGQTTSFSYDADGNITSVTPPGKAAHAFSYNVLGLVAQYMPPSLQSKMSGANVYSYDLDKRLTKINLPSGEQVDFNYDPRTTLLTSVGTPLGKYSFDYRPKTDLINMITTPDGVATNYAYVGNFPIEQNWIGPINAFVNYAYNTDGTLASVGIAGANKKYVTQAINYDLDSLIIGVGNIRFARNSFGAISSSVLGKIDESIQFNDVGSVISDSFAFDKQGLFSLGYTRDKIGRVIQKNEVQGTVSRVSSYEYDVQGRLVKASSGADARTYTYDTNGNRIGFVGYGKSLVGTYDEQDRLISYGDTKYEYTDNGSLLSKAEVDPVTKTTKITNYTYDVFGNLRKVVLSDGRVIEYIIDGQNRRIGKKINGKLVQAFVYQNQLQIAGELDGAGNLVKTFVYGSKINIPDYVNYNGKQYRIVSDQVGTPKLIVDSSSGQIVETLSFDEFGVPQGKVSSVIPFGFAGGLLDADTGLMRLGARDYDPETGRWTSKDPILFRGKMTNLYGYSFNDPINYLDRNGNEPITAATAATAVVAGFFSGAVTNTVMAYVNGERNSSNLISAFILGGVGGAAAGVGLVTGGIAAGIGVASSFIIDISSQLLNNSSMFDLRDFANGVHAIKEVRNPKCKD
ncbi:RHS repeat domain-containing protein [Bdellovibrio bacteriovorus]|uniref:RHS repeat domain-containing protein n=1 Tax=Bdellovibrio TaxID=958 RepID=UPI0035A8AB67